MSIKVLYIHFCGQFGGASKSLIEMIKSFPKNTIKAHIISPSGSAAERFESMSIPIIKVLGISTVSIGRVSYFPGVKCIRTLRELLYLPSTIISIIKAKKLWKDIDIIHVNEVNAIISIVMAKLIFNKPLVVHVRSLVNSKRLAFKLANYVLTKFADIVVPIDESVKRMLPSHLKMEVVHNGFSFKLNENIKPLIKREKNNCNAIKVGFVSNLLRVKGIYEFIEAAKICKQKGLNIEFIIAGDNVRTLKGVKKTIFQLFGYDDTDVKADVSKLIEKYNLQEHVHLIGFIDDVEDVYENIDILCFPSYLDTAGRPVFEAAFSKVPSIVAFSDPTDDIIINGKTGLCVKPKEAMELANAIEYLTCNPYIRKNMGEAAFELAQSNFNIKRNAFKMLQIYKKLMGMKC
ncbi:hypothetical protein ES704_00048 [subsurface metagenome]|jgi:glycosyltransferase involved in cell wall biosynthesis